MKTLGNKLVALVVIVTLAVIASLMNPKRAVAEPSGSNGQPGAPVNIVGPLPVPISGAVTVSGTVAATQSGPWNVGISGTPSVNIASAPAFSVAPTALVFDQILSLGATQTIASPPLDVRGFKSLRLLISNISGLPGASVSVVYWGPGGRPKSKTLLRLRRRHTVTWPPRQST